MQKQPRLIFAYERTGIHHIMRRNNDGKNRVWVTRKYNCPFKLWGMNVERDM